jgi:hypothetical protein
MTRADRPLAALAAQRDHVIAGRARMHARRRAQAGRCAALPVTG